MRARFVGAVFVAALLAWLATFSLNCYHYGLPSPQPSNHPRDDSPPFPGGTADNIFWFLQVSDVHISVINDLAVIKDFTTFCSEVVNTVNPALVLVTGKATPTSPHPPVLNLASLYCLSGDLTHAKYSDERRSRQFEKEWQAYAKVLRDTDVTKKTSWLDIRGNHGVQ